MWALRSISKTLMPRLESCLHNSSPAIPAPTMPMSNRSIQPDYATLGESQLIWLEVCPTHLARGLPNSSGSRKTIWYRLYSTVKTTEPMSAAELQTLKQTMGLTRNLIYFVSGGFVVLLLLSPSVISGLNGVIVGVGVLLTIAFMIWAISGLLGRIGQDVKNGVKLVQIATVEQKLMVNGTSPAIVLKGEQQLITKEAYETLVIGDSVQLEVTPLSRTFISLKKI
jgi:hypothetical protein